MELWLSLSRQSPAPAVRGSATPWVTMREGSQSTLRCLSKSFYSWKWLIYRGGLTHLVTLLLVWTIMMRWTMKMARRLCLMASQTMMEVTMAWAAARGYVTCNPGITSHCDYLPGRSELWSHRRHGHLDWWGNMDSSKQQANLHRLLWPWCEDIFHRNIFSLFSLFTSFQNEKPTCCCELETRTLGQNDSSELLNCDCQVWWNGRQTLIRSYNTWI